MIGTKNGPRRSNLRFGLYRSLRHAYMTLKPDMTYLTFYKRVTGGMSPEEAATRPTGKRRPRRRPLEWENNNK